MANECISPFFKEKLKSSFSCFRTPQDRFDDNDKSPRSAAYTWLKSTANDLEIRERCRGLIGIRGKCRRSRNSADFSYDAMSYSLNFENKNAEEDELALNAFISRLPVTPQRSFMVN